MNKNKIILTIFKIILTLLKKLNKPPEDVHLIRGYMQQDVSVQQEH